PPPAPNDYQYDVNFNEPVDPASVQTSDLTVSGNSSPSVTAVSVINANMTARFTLHMNSGTELTASIAAGAITDQFGNAGAAFTGNYRVEWGRGGPTWNLNPASGDWNTASNWTPATVPNGPAYTATFDVSNMTFVGSIGYDDIEV